MLCMTDGSKGASVRVIRELRDAKGWSQTELEARSGVPQTLPRATVCREVSHDVTPA